MTPTVKHTPKQKLFEAQVVDACLCSVIECLPGYSHCGPITQRHTSWYPFVQDQRKVFFYAKHRTQAVRQLTRAMAGAREVVEYRPESPERYVRRKKALATELCKSETQRGYFGRVAFYRAIVFGGAK